MESVPTLNELCSAVKRAVLRSVGDTSRYYSNGVFDLTIAMKDGTCMSFHEDANQTYITLCNTMVGEQEAYVGKYDSMKAKQRTAFISYLAMRCFEECMSADGTCWVQEIGADDVAAQMLNNGITLQCQWVSHPFYII